MQIEPGTRLLGVPVVDAQGHRLGRVITAYCTPDPLTAVWLVLRMPGLRRRRRAVPARQACWTDAAQNRLQVAHPRGQVLASPAVDEDSLDTAAGRAPVERFYATEAVYAAC